MAEVLVEKRPDLFQPLPMIVRCCRASIVALLLVAGCQKQAASEPAAPPKSAAMPSTNTTSSAIPGWPPTKAQPKLQTMKLYVGPETVAAEVCMTQVQIGTGMMFRKEMGENEGMLFVFPRPHRTSFYMKNTLVPLNIAYIDSEAQLGLTRSTGKSCGTLLKT